MKITKTHNAVNAQPEEITVEQAEEYLEERGYYAVGTVKAVLKCACRTTLRTPWAYYDFDPTE